ncbi:MAG: hypothetical protein IPP48_05995 [Chitinophagaceae bacterium]|nr:hypothetical protein [Chitinophagaceae bacterium]
MKYKNFKQMDDLQMKKVMGGVAEPNCTASVTCGNGHTYSCAGNTGTWSGDGSNLGCSGLTI